MISTLESLEEDLGTDWDIMRKLMSVYAPDVFNLDLCTFEMYKFCSAFISTRCFGFGLPTSILAPIADSFNHSPLCPHELDIVNKRLHSRKEDIPEDIADAYFYPFDWATERPKTESVKLRYKMSDLLGEHVKDDLSMVKKE